MPRQRQLPHTAPAPGPCDRELEAWLDAREEATDSAAEKRRKYTELLDAMIEAGVSRIPYVDPATNKRKWLAVRSEAKLVSAKAETGDGEDEGTKRTAVRTPTTPPVDPFGDTRADMAENSGSEPATAFSDGLPAVAGSEPNASSSDSVANSDLRTAGQQRRRGGAR